MSYTDRISEIGLPSESNLAPRFMSFLVKCFHSADFDVVEEAAAVYSQ